MNNELWLIWKEPLSHRRFKIGILIKLNDGYEFSYVDPELGEARKVGFNFFPGFNDLSKTYKNNELFINIASRLLNKGRIDYLEPEPNNKNDENAVKVVLKENGKLYHLGYVPRYYSKELLNELNKGAKYSAMIQNLKFNSPFSDENIVANVKLIFDV